MRVSPVAWLCASEDEVRLLAERSAAITHNHPEGIKGAVSIAVAIYRMRTAARKTSGIFEAVAREFYGDDAFSALPDRGRFDVTCQGLLCLWRCIWPHARRALRMPCVWPCPMAAILTRWELLSVLSRRPGTACGRDG